MSRQGLRSATSGNDQSQEDLDRTLVEIQETRGSSSNMNSEGHVVNRSHGSEELSDSLAKKLEELEKRVKKILEEERKKRERQDTEKERNLQILSESEKQTLNAIQTARYEIAVEKIEIRLKVEEVSTTNPEMRERLEDILWRHKAVFRKEPGRLKSYQHFLRVKEKQSFIGRRYPIPIAYCEKVDEESRKMLNMGIIHRSSSPYINGKIKGS